MHLTSCFFDNGIEMWYQAFLRWQGPEREQFLSQLPSTSALSCFFYHFQRRIKYLNNQKLTDAERERHLNQELGLGQAKARQFILGRWKLYSDPNSYGCATTWMYHAIRVMLFIQSLGLDIVWWATVKEIIPSAFPLAKAFEISDSAGNLIQYQLIGTISFDAGRKHWTSKLLTAFQTVKSLLETVSAYDAAVNMETKRPKTSPIEIEDTPSPDNSVADYKTADGGEDVAMFDGAESISSE
ncbi:hypothetical protein R3P38DRAFT_2768395 [Favolaschia claudopus]|uniref:Uncharacterized protein n=1 Tax=Favolaschia claudopus TaxID=2862362 RepID=A0AAW0CPI1_9AGAR